MPQITLPADGGCRCGKVRFRVTTAPLLAMACHCGGAPFVETWTSAAYAAT